MFSYSLFLFIRSTWTPFHTINLNFFSCLTFRPVDLEYDFPSIKLLTLLCVALDSKSYIRKHRRVKILTHYKIFKLCRRTTDFRCMKVPSYWSVEPTYMGQWGLSQSNNFLYKVLVLAHTISIVTQFHYLLHYCLFIYFLYTFNYIYFNILLGCIYKRVATYVNKIKLIQAILHKNESPSTWVILLISPNEYLLTCVITH